MISSLADCSVSSYFFSAVFASAMTHVFGVGFPVSISAILFWMAVELCHTSSNTVENASTRDLQFVQRHTSFCLASGVSAL